MYVYIHELFSPLSFCGCEVFSVSEGKTETENTCGKGVKGRDLGDERLANWKIEECITGNFNKLFILFLALIWNTSPRALCIFWKNKCWKVTKAKMKL
jgi:hypothetical protein